MSKFLGKMIIESLILYFIMSVISGVTINSFWSALGFVLIYSTLGKVLKVILQVISLPISIITLGIFYFIVNGVIFLMIASMFSGIIIDGLFTAIILSILFSLIQSVFNTGE